MEAAARAFPNRGRSRYAEVLVVLIQWEESELDAQSEVSALRSMFEIRYGFTTDIWSIPPTNAHNKLMLKVSCLPSTMAYPTLTCDRLSTSLSNMALRTT
jgi:hypothetical protein